MHRHRRDGIDVRAVSRRPRLEKKFRERSVEEIVPLELERDEQAFQPALILAPGVDAIERVVRDGSAVKAEKVSPFRRPGPCGSATPAADAI